MRRLIGLILIVLLTACGSAAVDTPVPATNTPATGGVDPNPPTAGTPIISLDRQPCFGFCPDYHLTVWSDGTVVFEGRNFVEFTGTHTGTITLEAVQSLITEFENAGFMDMNDAYMELNATDLPYVTTAFTATDASKTIQHYHGDMSAPPALTALEDQIDAIVNTKQWIGNGGQNNGLPGSDLGGGEAPLIVLERQPCRGFCPDYTLSIWPNGDVQFDGRQYVDSVGLSTGSITPDQVQELLTEFENLGFTDLEDEYIEQTVTDQSYVMLSLTHAGGVKTIYHYLGDRNAPKGLTELEDLIDGVVDTQQWIGNGGNGGAVPPIDPQIDPMPLPMPIPVEPDGGPGGAPGLNQPIITLEREPCFGFCPVYRLAIWDDGTVQFEGLQYVDAVGINAGSISPDQLQELIDAFDNAGYMDLQDEYTDMVMSDAPYVTTSYTHNGLTKLIRHYHGDPSAPQDLTDLEDLIDTVVDTQQWIGNGGQ